MGQKYSGRIGRDFVCGMPEIIAFDIMYFGEVEKESDNRFATAAKEAGNVILASHITWKDKGGIDADGNFHVDYSAIDKIEYPYEALKVNSSYGFVDAIQDRDGVIRFEKYQIENNGVVEKSFAAQIYETHCKNNGIDIKEPKTDDDIFLRAKFLQELLMIVSSWLVHMHPE